MSRTTGSSTWTDLSVLEHGTASVFYRPVCDAQLVPPGAPKEGASFHDAANGPGETASQAQVG
ncbi:hypothetical protein CFK38_07665 [Brachybacterium vulturis]|uniref:Uncharacterized protein n=1 Tax=Brachybacterium vulturis TaxID=2017484 RepID=A0A291GML9_9MICO|nr:hypothetical protein [Brachybacterium vulturis]ATG51417.1 hypothetical protein CFK38_07665 [Brachybacterium vulturis]